MPFQEALLSLRFPDEETEAWGGDLTLPKVPQPAGDRTEISNKCPESELVVSQAGRAPCILSAATLRPHSRDEESRGWLSITSRAAASREDLLQARSVTPMTLLTPHFYPEQLPYFPSHFTGEETEAQRDGSSSSQWRRGFPTLPPHFWGHLAISRDILGWLS